MENNTSIIIGIDHGNGAIKTANHNFACGFTKQTIEPAEIFSGDVILYKGEYYTLTDTKIPYKVDKTQDEQCFIDTLFAIAKELSSKYAEVEEKGLIGKEITLAVGLPPAHFERQKKSFQTYFEDRMKYGVNFKYNKKPFSFRLKDIYIYPQDYAAVVVFASEIINKYKAYCIDIGDGTVDLLALKDGIPDKTVMVSRELGISVLRNKIIDEVINDFSFTLDNDTIDAVLQNKPSDFLDYEIETKIKQEAIDWAYFITDQLHTKIPEFRNAVTIFAGGGSKLLKPYLIKTERFGKCVWIDEVKANAIGYETIAGLQKKG